MESRRLHLLLGALAVVVALATAHPAAAQPVLLKRSAENMLMAPLDAVVSPYTAWKTFDKNVQTMESTGGKVTTGIVGLPYYWGLYLVLAGFREAAGIAELPIGLALWPVNAFKKVELGPFFDSAEAGALVDAQTSVMNFKFGGRWLTSR